MKNKKEAVTKSLLEEAQDYIKKNVPKGSTQQDKVALRFYMGNALAGLIARTQVGRPEEIIREAYEYAKKCVDFEKDLEGA